MCMGLSACHVLQFSDGVVIFVMDVWVQRTCHDHECFHTQPKTFFADGIHRLVDQWDTCFNQQGDYVQTVDSYTDIVYVALFNL